MSKWSHNHGRCRGDSELVGVMLLTVLIVLLASVVGYYVLPTIGEEDVTNVELGGSVTSDAVTLVHGGGRTLDATTLEVVLRYDGSERRYDFEADGTCDDEDGRFEPGERWRLDGSPPYAAGDDVELLLVDTDDNAVLFRARRRADTPTSTPTPGPDA